MTSNEKLVLKGTLSEETSWPENVNKKCANISFCNFCTAVLLLFMINKDFLVLDLNFSGHSHGGSVFTNGELRERMAHSQCVYYRQCKTDRAVTPTVNILINFTKKTKDIALAEQDKYCHRFRKSTALEQNAY